MISDTKFSYLFKVITLALLYFIAGKISFAISSENSIVTIVIFTAEGFALAGILLFGRKLWLGIFIGQFLLTYNSLPLYAGLSISLINSLEAILAVTLFKHFKLNIELLSTKDVFGLIGLIVLILQPLSALLGNIVLLNSSLIVASEFNESVFSWWFGNIMGQILITPTLILLYTRWKHIKILELIGVGIFFASTSYLFQVVIPILNVSLLLSVTLPLIIYISSQKGLEYATFSVVIITMVTLYLTNINIGVFSSDSEINNLINLNFYFLSQMLLLLIIGTLFHERKQREIELQSRIAKEVAKNKEQTNIMLQQSRLAQMGQILNMVAHQWRQPLNNLLLINDLLVYKYEKKEITDADIKEFNEESTLQIKQMSGTIDDFRDFFHPRKVKVEFLLNDVIEHLLLIMHPIFKASEIKLIFKEDKDIYLYGYSNELAQAILNILYNAKDALIEHKTIEERTIEIELIKNNNRIILTITDNAGGISEDVILYIFDPYFSTKENKSGTGLGLYMSKMIIEKHMGGKLSIHNSSKGATFTIAFQVE
jgi:signal transduction histidine kinase